MGKERFIYRAGAATILLAVISIGAIQDSEPVSDCERAQQAGEVIDLTPGQLLLGETLGPNAAEEASANFNKVLVCMQVDNNPEVRRVANELSRLKLELDQGNRERIDFLGSINPGTKPVSAILSSTGGSLHLIIGLDLDELSDKRFSLMKTINSSMIAWYTIEDARNDPRKYGTDPEFRKNVDTVAAEKARVVFLGK